jgi:hypothetical protein
MYEHVLRDAMSKWLAVEFRYDDDLSPRLFQPYVLWRNKDNDPVLSGYVEANPAKPLERHQWKNLTPGLIRLPITVREQFRPEPTFYPLNKRYVGRVICVIPQYLNQGPLGNLGRG